jgi:hypothetical protein
MPVANYSNEGPRLTVNDLIKDPVLIPRRFLKLAEHEFMMESLLRRVPSATGGVIKYELEPPLFAEDDPLIVAEGGEIPLTQAAVGEPRSVITTKYGSGIEITKEMKTRNRLDEVNRRSEQVKNTFVRLYENQMLSLFQNAVTQEVDASTFGTGGTDEAWDLNDTTTIRAQILTAVETVAEARDASNNPLGFNPDTLVLSRADSYHLLRSEDFSKHYGGNVADENIQFSGKLPSKILGLNVLVSRFMPTGTAYVVERQAIGGFSDEYPLTAEPLEYEKRRQLWYSVVTRRTGMFIDQPKSACKLTNISS